MSSRVCVVGVGQTRHRSPGEDLAYYEIAFQAATAALADTGLRRGDIDTVLASGWDVLDGRTINAQTDIVYLDRGSADGVEPGDRLNVYLEHENRKLPRKLVGEVQVFIVKENTSTAMVRMSTDTLAKGDIVDFKK